MSGILNKKDSLIDYKLTENGRKQIQNNDINYTYYSFSDSSIVYNGNQSEVYDENISNSEFHYIPFEVSTDPNNYLNPEYNLTQKLDLNHVDNDILNVSNQSRIIDLNTKFTLSNQVISKKLLSNIDVLIENENFIFSRKESLTNYNFQPRSTESLKDFNFLINYPTIDKISKSRTEIPIISKDNRFSHKLNNKILNAINLNGSNILPEEDLMGQKDLEGISYIFNTMKDSNIKNVTRKEVIQEVFEKIKKYEQGNIYFLKYEISNKSKNLQLVTELHSLKTIDGNVKKTKLAFLSLGKFKDKKENKEFEVYLIGKIILNRENKEDYNRNSNTLKRNLSLEYSFINLFTLIAE